MKAERGYYLSQSQGNKGNGYRCVNGLGIGDGLQLVIPRDRLGQFKPWILHVMRESSEQLQALCFELYSKGLTTRDIAQITESIYGQHLSKSAISRITGDYAKEMALFRQRELEPDYPIVYVDALFVSTRRDKHVSKEAYYVVLGVKSDTTREVLGLYNAPTESATVWGEIIDDLKQRGLKRVQLFVTDNLKALDETIESKFTCPRIQKCVLHLKRNVLRRTKKMHRPMIAQDLKDVFDLENKDDTKQNALKRAKRFYDKWTGIYSHVNLFNQPEQMQYYFTYLNYDPTIRNMIYTTNWIERLNKDFKRTLKIRNSMPNPQSVLTLLCKVAIDKNNSTYRYPIHRLAFDNMFK